MLLVLAALPMQAQSDTDIHFDPTITQEEFEIFSRLAAQSIYATPSSRRVQAGCSDSTSASRRRQCRSIRMRATGRKRRTTISRSAIISSCRG
jgi:hypothetical protein